MALYSYGVYSYGVNLVAPNTAFLADDDKPIHKVAAAYMVMAYIDTAHIVIAHIVTAHIVMAYIVMPI